MRKIILTSSAEDSVVDAERVRKLLTLADELGFTLVSNVFVGKLDDPVTTLASHARDDRIRARIAASGIDELAALADLTAYAAWRLFGGLPVADEPDAPERRGRGGTFTLICRLMVNAGLSFQDFDPIGFTHYSKSAWEQTGATRRIAAALEGVEIFDIRIFVQLTDEDIDNLNYGPAYRQDITSLRDQLKRKLS